MSRSQRLLDLIQELRGHRRPVSGASLAATLGVSLRTLYRDIETLKAQGADIDGEAGLGFVLKPGFMLPPLMFSEDEIEAIVLGARWVADRTDEALGKAAGRALTKIAAVLPPDLRDSLAGNTLLIGPGEPVVTAQVGLPVIRAAIRAERKLAITYVGPRGDETQRRIWPFALAFFDRVRIIVAWCELREEFRSFRVDRISALTETGERYPRRRQAMLRAWRTAEGCAEA